MAKFITSFAIPFALLQYDSADRIARELWRTNQEFSPVTVILPWIPMLHLGMNNIPIGGRSSET
jgi:hypothetical protein